MTVGAWLEYSCTRKGIITKCSFAGGKSQWTFFSVKPIIWWKRIRTDNINQYNNAPSFIFVGQFKNVNFHFLILVKEERAAWLSFIHVTHESTVFLDRGGGRWHVHDSQEEQRCWLQSNTESRKSCVEKRNLIGGWNFWSQLTEWKWICAVTQAWRKRHSKWVFWRCTGASLLPVCKSLGYFTENSSVTLTYLW